MSSLTYQSRPEWLLDPLMQGVLTVAEASQLWDCWLLTPPGEESSLPRNLWPAAERMFLLEMEAQPTRH